jgi:hypothetical protein
MTAADSERIAELTARVDQLECLLERERTRSEVLSRRCVALEASARQAYRFVAGTHPRERADVDSVRLRDQPAG